jgi:hypothetical protein
LPASQGEQDDLAGAFTKRPREHGRQRVWPVALVNVPGVQGCEQAQYKRISFGLESKDGDHE